MAGETTRRKRKMDARVPCPICGKRICDCSGLPEGEFEIELKCLRCGLVRIDQAYLKNCLTLQESTG